METTILLQVFLLINVLLLGAVLSLAVQHAYAHFRPRREAPKRAQVQGLHLAADVKERILQTAEQRFQEVLERSADELQTNMKQTANQLNIQLHKLGTGIVESELQRYQASLEDLRHQTETSLTAAQSSIAVHQADLEQKFAARHAELEQQLTEEITAEKQRLNQQIDTKLADAVASFLLEALGHNVDLGAQSAYLTALLESHKAEFKQGVVNETAAAK